MYIFMCYRLMCCSLSDSKDQKEQVIPKLMVPLTIIYIYLFNAYPKYYVN